jgi:hypothetical protein
MSQIIFLQVFAFRYAAGREAGTLSDLPTGSTLRPVGVPTAIRWSQPAKSAWTLALERDNDD